MSDIHPKPNIPLTEDEQKAMMAMDAAWTGPRLIALLLGFMAFALFFLYLMADNIIGPAINQ